VNPKEYYSGFWEDLVNEYVTSPGGWGVPTDQFYEGFSVKGEPDTVFEEATGVSRFDNGNVIVGEIVEDEPREITA